MKVTLGIDIGGTNTVFGFVDEAFLCQWSDKVETQEYKTAKALFHAIFKRVDEALKNHNGIDLTGIGVGVPNGSYYTGKVEKAPNLPWKDADIKSLAQDFYPVPVAVTNDANAAAIAEMKFGAARGMKDFIEVTLGTGLGSGIVVNGKIVYGSDGFAGEMGHTIVKEYGRKCSCGRRGCLETYVSATGIKRTVLELLASEVKESKLKDIPFDRLSALKIYEEAKAGEWLALKAFEITGNILGRALADAAAYFSPQAIFLFGGLAGAGDLLLKPTRESFEENLLNIFQGKVKIMPSALVVDNAAILGAGALIWDLLNTSSESL